MGNTSLQLLSYTNLKKIALLAMGIKLVGGYSVALALEGDVIRPYASATYSYDDNLRRFSSSEQALLATGSSKTSDTFLMTGVGIILDKTISQQHFFVDISANRTKFDRNSDLDNDGKEMTGRWDWKVGKRFEGKFELYHKEALVPFASTRGFAMNMRTSDRRQFEARWLFHPRWRARGSLVNSETKYSSSQSAANLDEHSQEIGIDYLSPSRSVIGVQYRHVRGEKPVQIFLGMPFSNDYDQNELKLNIDWAVTGKSKLQFLGGVVDRKHDELPSRDFRRFNARGNFEWMPTGKIGLDLSAWRENNARAFVTTSYTVNTGAALAANWSLTGKLTMQGRVQYEKRDFVGDVFFDQERIDKNKNLTLGLVYRPTLSLVLNASFTHSNRESTNELLTFDSNSFALTGQYEF